MVLPSVSDFPYTMRLVSESMASNGSTSQASICASTLALMDGGVPIKSPVAGIAMGLMYENDKKYKILTDIQGPEDHHGDMDFKVAGTRDGVAAIQLDVKVEGVPIKILGEAMRQSKTARVAILDKIEKEIPKPRAQISPNAPKILIIRIKPDQIGMVIGGGGKTIKEINQFTRGYPQHDDITMVAIQVLDSTCASETQPSARSAAPAQRPWHSQCILPPGAPG